MTFHEDYNNKIAKWLFLQVCWWAHKDYNSWISISVKTYNIDRTETTLLDPFFKYFLWIDDFPEITKFPNHSLNKRNTVCMAGVSPCAKLTRLNCNLNLKQNMTTCPTYGQSLVVEQWTFLWMCEHLAHIAWTRHWESSDGTVPYCVVSYRLSYTASSHRIGCQRSPPPPPLSVVGASMLHPRHHPLFVSLRFSLARGQCSFLGTKYSERTA